MKSSATNFVSVKFVQDGSETFHGKALLNFLCIVYNRHLSQYHEKGDFLRRIVNGNEIKIHYYQPKSKRRRMEWKHPTSPAKRILHLSHQQEE
jgi:hypothetical protein